jgi:alkanesulfonate monooxygenase SsuD/methylene tetrahydromethanopterin reductase-like flavin-dependent oxidoreductase (luciferase family)
MHYGIVLTTTDPRLSVDLAAAAEAAGWDGIFTYDAIAIGDMPGFDPWVLLAACAMRTERVRLGAMVFAPSRRRPWKLARELATLDRLSGGRVVFPVGLGALDDAGFGAVGEAVDARGRAERLDETLEIVAGLATGEPFRHEGRHYRIDPPMTLRPTPVQRPRVPIWVVGAWPHERSIRRAARWDGIVVQAAGVDDHGIPHDVGAIVDRVRRERSAAGIDGPFDIVLGGATPADARAAASILEPAATAGATWWIEQDWQDTSVEALRSRIVAGPPRARGD